MEFDVAKIIVPYARNRIAYAVTKSLVRAGHKVTTADSIDLAMSRFSRYSEGFMKYPNNSKGFAGWCVYRMSEGYLIFPTFMESWNLTKLDSIPLPPYETIMRANDKLQVHNLCEELDIPTPHTEYVEDAVLKRTDGRGALGRLYVRDMLMQERVYGDAIGVGMLFNKGELRAKFSWKRLSEYPSDGGMSVIRESIRAPKQEAYAERLLTALEWHGVAMVEFKGEHVLEINPRLWGSLALTIDSGVDLPKLLVDMMIEGDCETVTNWEVGVRTSWLAGCMLRRCIPKGKLEDWSFRDPLPFFAQFLTVGYNLVRGKGLVLDDRR